MTPRGPTPSGTSRASVILRRAQALAAVPNGTKIREIPGKNLDLDLDLDLDVDLDPRRPAAGSQTGQLELLALKRMVYVQIEVQVEVEDQVFQECCLTWCHS